VRTLSLCAPLALAALVACDGKDTHDDTGDTGSDAAAYCEGLTVGSNANVATILEFSWTTADDVSAVIEWGDDGYSENTFEDVVSSGGSHSAQILGVPYITKLVYRITHDNGETCEGEITTNNLPSNMPSFTITSYDATRASPEPYLFGVGLGGQPAFFIIDRETGEYIWYKQLEGQPYLNPDAVFANDSNDIIYNQFDEDRSNDIGALYRETIDGELLAEWDTDWAHHSFARLETEETVAYMYADVREVTEAEDKSLIGVTAVGDAIWEVDLATGNTQEIFSAWDYLPVQKGDLWDVEFYPQGVDWTHGNALIHYPANPNSGVETYNFSFGGLDLILEIDRVTGEVLREFSGEGGYGTDAAYTVVSGLEFSFQHDTNWSDDGTLMMVSTNQVGENPNDKETVAVEYTVDDSKKQLTEIWSYGSGEGLQAFALGQARRLDNGNTLISWGSGGILREVTPEGDVVWQLSASAGNFFGQVELMSDPYTGE
jgi:hypothetical protein